VAPSRPEAAAGSLRPAWQLVVPGTASAAPWRFRPLLVLRVATLLMLVGQLGRIPVLSTGTSEAPLLVNDLFVLAILAVGALAAAAARSFQVDRVGGIALLFASVGLMSAALAMPKFGLTGMQVVISLAYLARWVIYFGIYLVVINVVRSDDVVSLWKTIETMMLVFAAFGIVQAIFLPHFAQMVYPDSRVYVDWDEQQNRLVSTVLDPNIAGAMILLVLLVQLAQLATGERVTMWKPLVLFAALVATLSRGTFLALLVGGAMIVTVRGVSRRMLQWLAVVALLLLAALPKVISFAVSYNKFTVDASALSRVAGWLRALRIFSDSPLIGIGFNTYGFVQESYGYVRMGASSYSVDGGLLFIAVMTGIVGVSLYVGMLALVVRRCRRIWRDPLAPPQWRSLALGFAAVTIAICVQALFVNSLLTTFVMEPLWMMWGLTFVMARGVPRPPPERPAALVVACRPGIRGARASASDVVAMR
jgi:hypothetical protein